MNQINGIDRVVFSKQPEIGTILVEGDTGVLKTTFVTECIKTHLQANVEEICLFITLKDDRSFLESRQGITELVEQKRLFIYNYDEILESIPATLNKRNIFDAIAAVAFDFKKKHGKNFTLFAIDPINSLEATLKGDNLRRVLFHFFSQLNELETKNWIIMESYYKEALSNPILPYHFLADGIINLGMMETMDDVIRYLEIIKMRGVNHSLNKFQMSYKRDGLKILGAIHES